MLIDGEKDDDELPPLPGDEPDDSLNDTAPVDDGAGAADGDANADEGAGGKGKQLSLREALIKATKEAEDKQQAAAGKNATGKNNVVKDPKTGKFTPVAATAAAQQQAPKAGAAGGVGEGNQQQMAAAGQPIKPSNRFPADIQAELAKLPPAVITALNAREEQVHQQMTQATEERKMGSEFSKVVAPYVAQIRSEGATPISAVAELFNMAYFLRNPTITPAAKGKFLWDTAKQFGADMRLGQQQMVQQPFNPQLHAVTQQVATLQNQIKQQQDQQKAAEQDAVNSQIATFKADTAHPHFDAVALDMAAMLGAGRAQSLQEAYDKACYANPEIRSIVLAADQKAAEEKRVADQKAKADAARKAGSSVRGGPGVGATKNGKVVQKTLRDEIAANMRALSEG